MKKSFVNFPFIRFNKFDFSNWVKENYIDNENRNFNEVREAYKRCGELIENGEQELADELQAKYNFEPYYDMLYQIMIAFSLKEPDMLTISTYAEILKLAEVYVDVKDDKLSIRSPSLNFVVKRFSDLEPQILRYLKDIDTPERKGTCHPYSVVSSVYLKSNKNTDSSLVTGRVYHLAEKEKFLHSWVEFDDNGEICVVDPAKNIVLPKDAYYEIYHVSKTVRLSSLELAKDYKMIRRLSDYDNYIVKLYYENPVYGRKVYKKLVKIGEIDESAPLL